MLFRKVKYLVFFLSILCIGYENITIFRSSKASEISSSEQSVKSINKNFYILGPGDQLSIQFVGAPELSSQYKILSDGNVQLPLLGSTNLSGLTLDKAEKKLVILYQNELIRPEIYLNLTTAKPLKVSVIGEILRPGTYTLSETETSKVEGSGGNTLKGYPTVVDAIQKAGGLTFDADITNVAIFRALPGDKGQFKKTDLNLLDMIQNGNQINNPNSF